MNICLFKEAVIYLETMVNWGDPYLDVGTANMSCF